MSQLPSRANVSRPSMTAIGSNMESSTDVLIQEGKSKAVSNTYKHYPDVIKDNARRSVNNAAAQTGREVLTGVGASNETADQVVNVARFGSNAQDSIINLGAGAIDAVTGTSFASDFVSSILPSITPGRSGPPGPGGQAAENSPIGRIRKRDDPLNSFTWIVQMPTLQNMEGLDMETFNYYVEEVNLAMPFFSSEAVFRDGSYVYYPQFSDVGSLSLTLYEDHNMTSSTYFEAWKQLIQDPQTRFYFRPKNYKKTIYLTPVDNMGIPSGMFIVEGAFPSNPGQVNFQSSSSDPVKRTIEFGINRIRFKPWEGREEAVNAARAGLPNKSVLGAKIKQANLADIVRNPFEFIRQVSGFSPGSDVNLRF